MREKTWADRSAWQAAHHSDDDDYDSSGMTSAAEGDNSVNLSDIKSENESVYWKENRGNVEAVDILQTDEKLFDHDCLDEFQENLRMLERIVTSPQIALAEYESKGAESSHAARQRK